MPKKNPPRKRSAIVHAVIGEELSYNTGRHPDQPNITRLTRTLVPLYGRKTEQAYLNARNALCRLPEFRRHIVRLRQQLFRHHRERLGSKEAAIRHTLRIQAREFCREWGISEGVEWVQWLIQNWDPTTQQLPAVKEPGPPPDIPRSLIPWTIAVESLLETLDGREIPLRATITLNAGISSRQAESVARLAAENMSPHIKLGRPGLTDAEREDLRSRFVALGVAKHGKRKALIRKVQKLVAKHSRELSHSVIAREYRYWLVTQGEPIRRVVTAKRDIRKDLTIPHPRRQTDCR